MVNTSKGDLGTPDQRWSRYDWKSFPPLKRFKTGSAIDCIGNQSTRP